MWNPRLKTHPPQDSEFIPMYKGSGKFFLQMLRIRAVYLYGAGGTVNTALQLLAINIGLISRGTTTVEAFPYYLQKWIFVMLPFLPPYTASDILSVMFNIIVGVLIAALWTARWSQGMTGYHGR